MPSHNMSVRRDSAKREDDAEEAISMLQKFPCWFFLHFVQKSCGLGTFSGFAAEKNYMYNMHKITEKNSCEKTKIKLAFHTEKWYYNQA